MKGRWRQIVLYHIGVNVGVTSSIGASLADPGETLPGDFGGLLGRIYNKKLCVWENLGGLGGRETLQVHSRIDVNQGADISPHSTLEGKLSSGPLSGPHRIIDNEQEARD